MTNIIGAPWEIIADESRVALTPDSGRHLKLQGFHCVIQAGAGVASGFSDADYRAAGVEVVPSSEELWSAADVIVKVRPPEQSEISFLTADKTLISFFYPAQNTKLLEQARASGATVIAMDMVPRISRAQKMDALSSMANIAGYRAVIEAGNHFGRFFTGQVTAAGKVPPAKVLVMGAGVAGLAAIGTATSLGAITYAFDVRPRSGRADRVHGRCSSSSSSSSSTRTGPRPAAMPPLQPRVPREAARQVPGTRAGD
jgi:NAD(P) transhydrogenase subunit alpha